MGKSSLFSLSLFHFLVFLLCAPLSLFLLPLLPCPFFPAPSSAHTIRPLFRSPVRLSLTIADDFLAPPSGRAHERGRGIGKNKTEKEEGLRQSGKKLLSRDQQAPIF